LSVVVARYHASSIVLAHPLFGWLRRWLAGQQGFLASFERPKGAVSQNQRSVNGERVRCVILTVMCDANGTNTLSVEVDD
jgi:hypothetical protein